MSWNGDVERDHAIMKISPKNYKFGLIRQEIIRALNFCSLHFGVRTIKTITLKENAEKRHSANHLWVNTVCLLKSLLHVECRYIFIRNRTFYEQVSKSMLRMKFFHILYLWNVVSSKTVMLPSQIKTSVVTCNEQYIVRDGFGYIAARKLIGKFLRIYGQFAPELITSITNFRHLTIIQDRAINPESILSWTLFFFLIGWSKLTV